MTTAAAQAALGPQAPVVQPERIAFVDVETGPKMIAMLGADGVPVGHYPDIDPALGLTDQMADRLREVCDEVDANTCEANGCVSAIVDEKGETPAPVGWMLAGDADERTEWSGVTLVQRGEHVLVVCADCSPSAIYDGLWGMK